MKILNNINDPCPRNKKKPYTNPSSLKCTKCKYHIKQDYISAVGYDCWYEVHCNYNNT